MRDRTIEFCSHEADPQSGASATDSHIGIEASAYSPLGSASQEHEPHRRKGQGENQNDTHRNDEDTLEQRRSRFTLLRKTLTLAGTFFAFL